MQDQCPLILHPEVPDYIGLSRSSLFRLRQRGDFPQPILIGPGRRHLAWRLADVRDWIDSRQTPDVVREGSQ